MAEYTRSQLATYTGKAKGTVSMAVSRGQLILNDDDNIDSDDPNNRVTIDKWLAVKKPTEPKPKAKRKPRAPRKPKPPPPPPVINSEPELMEEKLETELNSEVGTPAEQKIKAEVNYKKAQVRILKLNEAKLKGESIPIKIVTEIISILGASFMNTYKTSARNLMVDIAHTTKMSPENTGKYKGMLTNIINKSHKDAIREASVTIKAAVKEIKV